MRATLPHHPCEGFKETRGEPNSNLRKGEQLHQKRTGHRTIVAGSLVAPCAPLGKKFGSRACIGGNVPASLFKAGTPAQMDACVKKLMDTCAPGGGYFISPGAVIDQANAENVQAYLKAAKEYGVY